MTGRRERLVEKLLNQGYIRTDKVKKAMMKVPREEFIPPENRSYAYADQPLPIGRGQTLSAPHMVAIICEKLNLKRGMKVMEIGTGFGYNAAVVAELLGSEGHLFTVERLESLAESARDNLERTGYSSNVTVISGDGTRGYPEEAPYDRIYATASAPEIPEPLKEQLKIGGRLIAPVGSDDYFQELLCLERISHDEFKTRKLGGVVFVPMIGEYGWPED
ncbi:protein-L-isoaspartate O-methyltransferase [Methanobacterium aggregans]|uniref:protein-L-isoaspartate O-methyltransferase n=1 Tax=Methanobacterium aggregans TaxID=1615586 RepID=UPI001AE8185D|nr:protein-L-isoaspartate O-methyltransferase [Methanobacterium aggregans]MBP2046851.1 protein-L-isoaspartate(D-aspartate) O-methyltransferase [Methanobacterium aggregans]